jgi:hypothetical protein
VDLCSRFFPATIDIFESDTFGVFIGAKISAQEGMQGWGAVPRAREQDQGVAKVGSSLR